MIFVLGKDDFEGELMQKLNQNHEEKNTTNSDYLNYARDLMGVLYFNLKLCRKTKKAKSEREGHNERAR